MPKLTSLRFKDTVSGKVSTENRPNYQCMKNKLQAGDTIIVLDLDRLGCDAGNTLVEIKELQAKGVKPIVLDIAYMNEYQKLELMNESAYVLKERNKKSVSSTNTNSPTISAKISSIPHRRLDAEQLAPPNLTVPNRPTRLGTFQHTQNYQFFIIYTINEETFFTGCAISPATIPTPQIPHPATPYLITLCKTIKNPTRFSKHKLNAPHHILPFYLSYLIYPLYKIRTENKIAVSLVLVLFGFVIICNITFRGNSYTLGNEGLREAITLKAYIEERAACVAKYIIDSNATVREAAKKFGISKSTVHKDVTERLLAINPKLAVEARRVLEVNKSERHIRGGMATKEKYMTITKR